jgi:23S rRNA pseudouridine2605 synthase
VRGVPTPQTLERFRKGLDIEDYRTAPANVQIVKRASGGGDMAVSLKITIHEGRNRQVRKMCEAIGHPVLFLKRIATGKIYLGDLPRGACRRLTEAEVHYLKSL